MKKLMLLCFVITVLLTKASLAGEMVIKYAYDGKFGIYDIADTATAYYSGQGFSNLEIGFAQAMEIVEKNPGPNHIIIQEMHFNPDGSVMYQGLLEFQFGFGGGVLLKEVSIVGQKRNTLFTSWPAGR